MNLNEIQYQIKNLSWNKNKELQESAIESLIMIKDEQTPLLVQENLKDCWGNGVIVLKKLDIHEIKWLFLN